MTHASEASELQQELLEALWQERDEGRSLDWTRFPASAVADLERAGWVEAGSRALTAAGHDQARRAIRRHRLAERMLADLMGAAGSGGEADACRLEHSLMEGLAERVCTFLGHPRVCPHGHPIPEGPCCVERRSEVEPALAPLGALRAGESGTVAYLAAAREEDLQKFLSMGVHPGDRLELVRKSPTVVFRCGHARFAVDRELAAQIYVRRG